MSVKKVDKGVHLRSFGLSVALIALLLMVPRGPSSAAAAVAPVLVTGNKTCAQLVPGTAELKVEPVADGTYTDGTLTVTIDVRDTADGQVFDFTSNIGVDAVFVKGGPNGNLYLYDPEASSDTGLHAPVADNGRYHGLSHISFCYDVEPPTNTPTDTATSTPTNTPTDTATSTPTNTPTSTPTDTPTSTPTNTPTSTPTPVQFEGCTPGYWKQSQHFASWTGYSPNQTLESVFDVPDALGLDNVTLLEALNFQGGGGDTGAARILLRAAVAALLNAANPDVDYPLTTAEVIASVNTALGQGRAAMLELAATLDRSNNAGCPLK